MSAVTLVPYSPEWPPAFAAAAGAIAEGLGPIALRIDHIGSTSVPGLMSKDRIDLQVGVADLDVEHELREGLARANFDLRDARWTDHVPSGWNPDPAQWAKWFATGTSLGRPVNAHIRCVDRLNWRYALLFRDYLRAEPMAASAYAELKRQLAALAPSTAVYAEAKDPGCDLVMVAALQWAGATDWTPQTPAGAPSEPVARTPGGR
jgi:GrpB-like predicted nucleotidyltransferase (UPF0157 family)